MVEKMGYIKNPLTVMAIFATIAEVSGTVVLPLLSDRNQDIFIWFVMGFPSALVLLFFLTLHWNHKVLYAPSDFKDDSTFVNLARKVSDSATNDVGDYVVVKPSAETTITLPKT